MHLGSSEPVFAGGARFRRPRPSPGVHRVAAAGPQAGGAPRLGFFDLTCNEWVGAYTRCAQAFPRSCGRRWRRSRASSSRSAEFSFWASSSRRALTLGVAGMARPLSLSLAGRARNTDGTHPRASSGARSVVSGPFPEASVADTAASLICPRPDRPYGVEPVSTWEALGAAACRPP